MHLCSIGEWDTINWRFKCIEDSEFKEINERKVRTELGDIMTLNMNRL